MALFKKLVFLVFLFFFLPRAVFADDTCASLPLSQQPGCYSGLITDSQNQQKTLSSQISLINNEISLTRSRINLTEDKIDRLTDDVASISGKISSIEGSLNSVSGILLNRIVQTYKTGRDDQLLYLLAAPNFGDLIQRFEYLRIVQKRDKTRLIQMAAVKKNYNDQKNDLETAKKQKEILSSQLKVQKSQLDKQNKEKQKLLDVTKNDERVYASLRDQAVAQLVAFNSFVITSGGASLLLDQTKCDDWGCYYNQRDRRWGALALNHTGYTLANSGCLVTSMAMVISHYGHKDVTPVTVNSDPDNFAIYYPAFLNMSINAAGGWTRVRISSSQVDSELSAGRPVVIGIGYGPAHFIVLVSGSNGNYVMNDPYIENGKNISFNSKYSLSDITERDAVQAN